MTDKLFPLHDLLAAEIKKKKEIKMEKKIPDGMKKCSNKNCKNPVLPADLEHFAPAKKGKDGLTPRCRVCIREYQKIWLHKKYKKVEEIKINLSETIQVSIHQADSPELWERIHEVAKDQLRTPENQVRFAVRQCFCSADHRRTVMLADRNCD